MNSEVTGNRDWQREKFIFRLTLAVNSVVFVLALLSENWEILGVAVAVHLGMVAWACHLDGVWGRWKR